jgi:3-hydroxyisobutyrate dehydrogenase
MSDLAVGFVGLGNMGSALANNLVEAGLAVLTHDVAGSDRSPAGAEFVTDLSELARRSDTVVLSLPDGVISEKVSRDIVGISDRRVTHIIDTSTVGVPAARAIDALLAAADIVYVDAPVSGGVAGARARTLTVMYAGPESGCEAVAAVLAGLSDNLRGVGMQPGMAQALKLANNFLSATALAATSEAVAFGVSVGLEMSTMLEVLNVSSGRSAASMDKFVNEVLPGRYASGFANSLMSKDVNLYLSAVESQGGPNVLGPVTGAIWQQFAAADPGADFTRIYPFVEGSANGTE